MVFLNKKTRRRIRKINRRRQRKTKTSMGMVVGGFPSSKMVKLRYVAELALDPGSGLFTTQVYTANGMFDPNVTGIGHQPSNFDLWLNQYDHYTVLGSKLTAQWVPVQTANVVPGLFGCLVSDNGTRTSAFGSLSDLLEQPYNKRQRGLMCGIGNSGSTFKTNASFSATKFFGKPKSAILGDDQYRGSASGNPTDQAYYELYLYSVAGNNPGLCHFIVTIEYAALLSERRPTTAS